MKRPTFWGRCDWVNPFAGYNWLDFTLIHASGEYDCRFGNLEFHVALLGLHFGGTWHVADGDLELQARLKEMLADIEAAPVESLGREHADGAG